MTQGKSEYSNLIIVKNSSVVSSLCYYLILRLMELVSSVDLTLSSFKLLRDYGLSVPGAYRRIISCPQSLTWKLGNRIISHSSDGEERSTEQDSVILSNNTSEERSTEQDGVSPLSEERSTEQDSVIPLNNTSEERSTEQDSVIPLNNTSEERSTEQDIEMCFILESSCYATSMLRELLTD